LKFHARQFSALMEPYVLPPDSSPKRIFPMAFCCTIMPISWPTPFCTMTFDFMIFAGRVSASTTLPPMSTICSLCVMNWSALDSSRIAFLAMF
jgi:hypothetical protein